MLKYLYFPSISIEWACAAAVIICALVGVFRVLIHTGKISKRQGYGSIMLVSYVILLFIITVFSRPVRAERQYDLRIFWTYRDMLNDGISFLAWQILYNLCMFIPVGILVPYIRNKDDNLYRELLITTGIGVILSISIEILQLVFRRGVFEIDDIIHNVISVFLGYLLFGLCVRMKYYITRSTKD